MNHEELILKNQAVMMLALLAIFSKVSDDSPEDQKVAEGLCVQINKTCAVLPPDEDEEEEAK